MKRIAVFSLAYAPFVGGAEIAVREITRRVPESEFVILTKKFDAAWPKIELDGNVSIARLGTGRKDGQYYGNFFSKMLYALQSWREAERLHKKEPLRAIWGVMAAYAGLGALFFKLHHPEVPFLLTLQEGDSEAHILRRVGIFYPIWKMIFRKADQIQCISHYLADFARRHGAICPVEVVPNGVDIEKIQISKSKFQTKSKTIITTSRLVPKNGVDTLIGAAAELKKFQISNFKFQILGGGPDEQKLKDLAAGLSIADKVDFLGYVKPEEVPGYLSRADIFVRASRSEGLGNSFLEAMAAGLPVIGTPVGGIPDFLKDGETGLFCKVDDARDLAEKITYLFNNPDVAGRIAVNGHKLVLENYSWDKIASKMSDIFLSLVACRLSLLIATGIYPPDIGGPATYTILLEKELPPRGFKVGVLAFTKYRSLPKIFRHLAYFWRCLRMAGSYDQIYAQDPVSVGLPALLAARLREKKFFIRVAGDYAWEQAVQRFAVKDGIDEFQIKKYGWRTELLRKIQKFVVGRADLVITPSKYFQKLVGGWVSNPEKVHCIYNGIDLNKGGYGNWVRYRPQANLKTIFSAGRLVPWKGFDKLIEFMVDLPSWNLIIAGDGPEMANLKSLINHLNLRNRVVLTGSVPREELLDKYLKTAGGCVFALNTSFESFSFQLVEAMNAGMPIITTRIGNIQEIVTNNRDGILIEPNNKEEFLAAINKIISDKKFTEIMVMDAQDKAKQFSISRTVDNLVNLINDASR